MGEKKYYWLKLQNDFFSHKEIKKLRKIAGGDTYTVIYLKMLLVSLKNDGRLFYDGVEETFSEELALDLDEEKDNVDVTLKFLMVHGLIEETSQNQFSLPGTINAIGAETSGNIRVKRHREKLKALQCNDSVTSMKRIVNGEKEKDLEIDKDKDIDKEKEYIPPEILQIPDRIPYKKIVDAFNEICTSLLPIQKLSDNRKSVIKARYKDLDYSMDKVKEYFTKVQASDFLTGKVEREGKRPFKANFDWVIKSANFIKVIEGNYDNKKQATIPNRPLTAKELTEYAKDKYFI